MKFEEKIRAIELRKQGYSYPKILSLVNVSKSTLSLWLRDVNIPTDKLRLLAKGREISRAKAAEKRKELRLQNIKEVVGFSRKDFKKHVNENLFSIGLSLYWAEGDKHKQERVKFTNSDPLMIKFMMRWFREICNVPEKKFRISLHVHNLHIKKDVVRFWSNTTGIPSSQFHKLYIKNSTLHQRRNILYNGTCGIVISDKNLFRKILGWKLGLLDHFRLSPRSSMDRTRDF